MLADVLDVAVERDAAKIIDLATLTGACVVALGLDVTGLMTNDQAWCDEVTKAAKTCGERAWQLPMFSKELHTKLYLLAGLSLSCLMSSRSGLALGCRKKLAFAYVSHRVCAYASVPDARSRSLCRGRSCTMRQT